MDLKYYLAIDIGASSGRHIVGWEENGRIQTDEVYRFQNSPDSTEKGVVWDIDRIFAEVKTGIKAAFEKYGSLKSLAVDTWGVDYVLIKDKKAVKPCFCYRDSRTADIIGEVHSIVSFEELYRKTGVQFQPFNSLYQLYSDKKNGRLDDADCFLMIPEYLNYLLTGVIKKEYTNATTTGIVNCKSKRFDDSVTNALGFPEKFFVNLAESGEILGELLPEIAAETGGQTKVVLCASHDTASAFEAVDNESDSLILSSGTWSLLGAKIRNPITSAAAREANFTNEGGTGYIRFLKNIAGLFLITRLAKQSGLSFGSLIDLAEKSTYAQTFDIDAPEFLSPENICADITGWFEKRSIAPPLTIGDFANSIYNSLAKEYCETVKQISEITNIEYSKLYIVGGGAKDRYLCGLTSRCCGIETVALPIEATALGNLKLQIAAYKGEI